MVVALKICSDGLVVSWNWSWMLRSESKCDAVFWEEEKKEPYRTGRGE